MTDNVTANPSEGGATFKTDEVAGVHTPISKIAFGVDGVITTVDGSNPLPVISSGEVSLDASTLAALETVQVGNFPATQPVSGTVTANTGLSQPVTDAQLRATPVPVSGTVSTGGLTDTQLRASAIPVSGTVTANTGLTQPLTDTQLRANALNTKAEPPMRYKWGFAKSMTGVDPTRATVIQTGTGMAVNQSGGKLVLTTGITAYSETVIRTTDTFMGQFNFWYKLILSQRIANNNFVIELTDVIGDNLPLTINSATSITVGKTAHGFTSENVGQGMWVGMVSVASCLTQRAVIASVTDDTITLTVVGFASSGTGTCSLFGYNYHQVIYNGTSATVIGGGYQVQRQGWPSLLTSATINTTATGHVGIIESTRGNDSTFMDRLVTAGTGLTTTRLGTSECVPDDDVPMFIQIRAYNGTVAPATTTTMSLGYLYFASFEPHLVNITGVNPIGSKNPLTVTLSSTSVSATTTLSSAAPTIYSDTTTNLGAGATYTGTSRDAASTNTMRHFTAHFYSDKAGTSYIQNSIDATNWVIVAKATLTALEPVTMSVDVMARYHRVLHINGVDAQGSFAIRSSYQRV